MLFFSPPPPFHSPFFAPAALRQPPDLWRFEYTCAWIKPQPEGPWPARLPAYTVQRDLYTVSGTNIPLAMNETLTSGMSIFRGTQVGPQDTGSVFGDFLDGYNCLDTSDPNYYAVCNRCVCAAIGRFEGVSR